MGARKFLLFGASALCSLALFLPSAGAGVPGAAVRTDSNATVHYLQTLAPTSFDPILVRGNAGSWRVHLAPVYDRLLLLKNQPDGGAVFTGMLAQSFSVSPDGLTVDLKLRKGVKFQDGTAFDATAVKTNLDRVKAATASPFPALLASQSSVDVVDPLTVKIHLSAPDSSYLYQLADVSGMIVSPTAISTNLAGLVTAPVGSGPYKLASQTATTSTYSRLSDYWDKARLKMMPATLIIETIADGVTRVNAVKSGQANIASISSAQFEEVKSYVVTNKNFSFGASLGLSSYMVQLNFAKAPLTDVNVRRAISMAIDRKTINKTLFPANPPSYQPFPPGFAGYDKALDKSPTVKFNVAAAKKLVDAAGANGATLEFDVANTDPYPAFATVVQQQLAAIGLNANITLIPATDIVIRWATGQFHLMMQAISSADPYTFMSRFIGLTTGAGGTPPQEARDLLAAAQKLTAGSPQEDKAYQALSKYLVENPLTVNIVRAASGILADSKIGGLDQFYPLGIAAWGDVTQLYVAKPRK